METRTANRLGLGLVALSFVVGALFYPFVPERIVTHWGAGGQPNGTMSKLWGLFLLPVVSALLLALFNGLPAVDPLGNNVERFRGTYDEFVVLLLGFLLYLQLLLGLWNVGVRFQFVQALAPAYGALLYYAGVLMEHAERNWFVGIRTPWTLSNEEVWRKTHDRSATLFKLAGAVALLGVFVPGYALVLLVVPVLLAAGYAVVYSYVEYQRVAVP